MKIGIRLFLFSFLITAPLLLQAKPINNYNSLRVELPSDGGGMLIYSKMWQTGRFFEFGFDVGGGVIERDFDLTFAGGIEKEAETKALVLPYIGPRVTFWFYAIGVSLGYGAYYAKTDLDVEGPLGLQHSGETSGWGSAVYTPILTFDFYNQKLDMYFGLGLGGFFSSSYPDLEATNGPSRIVTDESPIDTITFSLSTRWFGNRKGRSYEELD